MIYNKMQIEVRERITDIITAKQNDSESRFLDVFLLDNGIPLNLTGHEVRIYMKKPDGTEIFNNGVITEAANGRCQFPLTDQALAAVGLLKCEISLWKNNKEILSTQVFDIFVTESLRSDGSVESSNEYGALVVLYQNLYESIDLMTDMVQSFGAAGAASNERNISTFWQGMEYLARYMDTDLKGLLDTVLSEASIQGVIDRLGDTADSGGTSTAGTVMGKLNGLIEKPMREFEGYFPILKSYNLVKGYTDSKSVTVTFQEPVYLLMFSTYYANMKYGTFTLYCGGKSISQSANISSYIKEGIHTISSSRDYAFTGISTSESNHQTRHGFTGMWIDKFVFNCTQGTASETVGSVDLKYLQKL